MKALVLAGGFPQIALINELKRRGYFVLVADYNANPVAKKFADKYYRESTLDVEAIRKIVREEKPEVLMTVCTDQALLTVARVSEEFGLPCYLDYKTALKVTNKTYMKEVFVKSGIPTAKHIIVSDFKPEYLDGFRFPLIIKPVDCNSSKGVIKVFDIDSAKAAVENAIGMSRAGSAVVEEYKEGIELSIEVYVENGTAKTLCVTGSEKLKSDDKFIIFREKYPSGIDNNAQKQIDTVANKIADAFNLKNSPMLIQAIWDGKELSVIEFSARTGGGVKHILLPRVSGVDIVKETVDLTLGKTPRIEVKQSENLYLLNEYIYCYPGKFKCLKNFEELKSQNIIDDYYIFQSAGAEFDSISASGDRIAGFTVSDSSIEGITNKHNAAVKMLKVLDEEDNDMMRHDLLADVDFV